MRVWDAMNTKPKNCGDANLSNTNDCGNSLQEFAGNRKQDVRARDVHLTRVSTPSVQDRPWSMDELRSKPALDEAVSYLGERSPSRAERRTISATVEAALYRRIEGPPITSGVQQVWKGSVVICSSTTGP